MDINDLWEDDVTEAWTSASASASASGARAGVAVAPGSGGGGGASCTTSVPLNPVLFFEVQRVQHSPPVCARAYVLPDLRLVLHDFIVNKCVELHHKNGDKKTQISMVCTALRHCFPLTPDDVVHISVHGVYPARGGRLNVEDVETMFSRRVGAPRVFTAFGHVQTPEDCRLLADSLFVALTIMESMLVSVLCTTGRRGALCAASNRDDDEDGDNGNETTRECAGTGPDIGSGARRVAVAARAQASLPAAAAAADETSFTRLTDLPQAKEEDDGGVEESKG